MSDIELVVEERSPVNLSIENIEVNPELTHDHAELTNLDYEHSGHYDFASLAGLTAETSARQTADVELSIAVNAKYTKPPGGIPKSDLSSAVQTSLDKADSSLQEHQSLVEYATKAWVEAKGYITSLVGYATEAWVTAKNYATQSWVEAKGYLTEHQSLSAYRTAVEQDVIDGGKQGVLSSSQMAAVNSGLTSTHKSKLDGIEAGAEVNVRSDWNATSGDAEILNKPTIQSISVSDSGSSTNEVRYITIDGIEKKLAGGGTAGFEINSSGNLILTSTSQTEASAYAIDDSGHLIINL